MQIHKNYIYTIFTRMYCKTAAVLFYSLLKLILHLQLLNVDHIVSTQKYLYVTTLEVMYIEVVRKTGNRCLAVHVSRWGDPTFPLLILTHLKNFIFKNKMNNMTFHFWL